MSASNKMPFTLILFYIFCLNCLQIFAVDEGLNDLFKEIAVNSNESTSQKSDEQNSGNVIKFEQIEYDEQKMAGKLAHKFLKLKKEPKFEEEEDKTGEDKKNLAKMIKKEEEAGKIAEAAGNVPKVIKTEEKADKISEKITENPPKTVEEDEADFDQEDDEQKTAAEGVDKIKLMVINEYDRMKNEYKKKMGIKNEKNRYEIEQKIAIELGANRRKIYQWKREINQMMKKDEGDERPTKAEEQKENERRRELINKFDQTKKECQLRIGPLSEKRHKIEGRIAKTLGTTCANIYEWKKELNNKNNIRKRQQQNENEIKMSIVKKFEKIINKNKNGNENRIKMECEIAKKFGTTREKIYEWKREENLKMQEVSQREKMRIVKAFDKMKKSKNQTENEIAMKLGTNRRKIYEWKREMRQKEKGESGENELEKLEPKKRLSISQKKEIIENFEKQKEKFSRKFQRKSTKKIDEQIAKKFSVSLMSINRWKKSFGHANYQ